MYSHLVLAITLSTNLATAQKPWQDFTIHQRTVLNPSGNNMTIPAPVFYNGTVADAPETNLDHIYYYGCGPVNKQQLANAVAYIRPAAQNLSDLVWAAPDEDPAARAALNAAFRYAFTTPDSVEYQHKVSNTFLAMAKGVTIDWDPPPGGSPRWSPTRNACIKGEPVYNNAAGAAWYSSVVFHNDANLLVRPFLNPSDDCPKWIISYANDRSTMTYVAHEMAHMGGASLEPEVYPLADILNSMFPGDAVNNAENYAFMLQFYATGCAEYFYKQVTYQSPSSSGTGRTLLNVSDAWNYANANPSLGDLPTISASDDIAEVQSPDVDT